MKRLVLSALLAVGTIGPASAANVVKTYSYYRIGGKTLDEIETQLAKRGPEVKTTGLRHPGATQMSFSTRIGYAIAILARGIAESGISHAIVAPRHYLENLLLPMVFETVKVEGALRYPVRADLPVSWSSHLDVADGGV